MQWQGYSVGAALLALYLIGQWGLGQHVTVVAGNDRLVIYDRLARQAIVCATPSPMAHRYGAMTPDCYALPVSDP